MINSFVQCPVTIVSSDKVQYQWPQVTSDDHQTSYQLEKVWQTPYLSLPLDKFKTLFLDHFKVWTQFPLSTVPSFPVISLVLGCHHVVSSCVHPYHGYHEETGEVAQADQDWWHVQLSGNTVPHGKVSNCSTSSSSWRFSGQCKFLFTYMQVWGTFYCTCLSLNRKPNGFKAKSKNGSKDQDE